MKYFFTISCILALALLGGSVHAISLFSTEDDYYPINENVFEYEDHSIAQGYKYLRTEKWGNKEEINDLLLETKEVSQDGKIISKSFIEKDASGIYIHGIESIASDKPSRLTFSEKRLSVKLPIKKDDTWTYKSGDKVIKCKVESIDDEVTVPAGSFKKCVRISQEGENTKLILWLAPNIGVVKTHFSASKINSIKSLVRINASVSKTAENKSTSVWDIFGKRIKLSEEEVKRIITDHLGFPKIDKKRIDVPKDSYVKMLSGTYFKREKYQCGLANLEICRDANDLGKPYLDGITENPYDVDKPGRFAVVGAIFKREIKEIKEILIDEQTNIALVTYMEGDSPIAEIHQYICYDNHISRSYCSEGTLPKTKTIKLKEYDKGWRVYEE